MAPATNVETVLSAPRRDVECAGFQWSLGPDTRLCRSLVENGAFEPHTSRLLQAAIKPGMTVLDIGAHIGWHTLRMAHRVGDAGRVIAFEPIGAFRKDLQQHLAKNRLQRRVAVVPIALSDIDGKRPCITSEDSASLCECDDAQLVKVRRLDDVAVEMGLPRIDFIKLDVDGHELRVLDGARHVLQKDRPMLSLAFHRSAAPDLRTALAMLHDLHYELCDEATCQPFAGDEEFVAACGSNVNALHALAVPVEKLANMPVRLHATLKDLQSALDLTHEGAILEPDIDVVENECELHQRKRRDAEALCTVARNANGPCLDLGTSHGRSAFKLATNVGPKHTVYTVNMLPEQAAAAGVHVTHVLTKDQIGAYCRERGIENIEQIYANTAEWTPAPEIHGLAMAFVDACHDAEAVRRDSHLAWQRLRAGGFMLWHDFSPVMRHRHEWIKTSMEGVAAFLRDIGHRGPVHHLRGSWIGLIRKAQ